MALVLALPACSDPLDQQVLDPVVQDPSAGPGSSSVIVEEGGSGAVGFVVIPEIVAEVAPSVVAVLTPTGEGSGVVWDDDGTIVTNAHVGRSPPGGGRGLRRREAGSGRGGGA